MTDLFNTSYETISFTESRQSGIQQEIDEYFEISDEGRSSDVSQVILESLEISEAKSFDLWQDIEEELHVIDSRLRNANGVVHDILISSDGFTENDFLQMAEGPPVGYDDFLDFIPGEYEYQNALTGIRVHGSASEGLAGVTELQLNVDIDNKYDGGTYVIATAAKYTVPFNVTFKVAPATVTATFTAGSTMAGPKVTNITVTGFDIELRDFNNPATLVAGSVTWSTIGY